MMPPNPDSLVGRLIVAMFSAHGVLGCTAVHNQLKRLRLKRQQRTLLAESGAITRHTIRP